MTAILIAASLLCTRRNFDVGLRYGLHSYQGLAAELTEQGIATRCEPSIRRRFALIRVPPRPWDSLRPLLETALDIKFNTTDDGVIEIAKDPQQAILEGLLLRRLSRLYSNTIEDAVRNGWDFFKANQETPPGRDRQAAEEDARQAVKSLPVGHPDRNSMEVAFKLEDNVAERYLFADLWDGINLAKLLKGTPPRVATAEQISWWPRADNPIGSIVPTTLTSFGAFYPDGVRALPQIMVDRLSVKWTTLSLYKDVTEAVTFYDRGQRQHGETVIPDPIEFECAWNDLYRGLPSHNEYLNRAKSSEAWLESQAAELLLNMPPVTVKCSDLFDRWSAVTGHPVIMEVLPTRDFMAVIPWSGAKSTSIRACFEEWRRDLPSPKFMGTPWTIEENNGITIVRDEVGFADHLATFNPEPEVALSCARNGDPDLLNTIDDYIKAIPLATVSDVTAAMDAGAYDEQVDFPGVWPYLRLLSTDAGVAKQLESLSTGQELLLPVSKFGAAQRRAFEAEMRQFAVRLPALWTVALWPEFHDVLASANIVVRMDSSDERGIVKFRLISPQIASSEFGLCPASLANIGPAR